MFHNPSPHLRLCQLTWQLFDRILAYSLWNRPQPCWILYLIRRPLYTLLFNRCNLTDIKYKKERKHTQHDGDEQGDKESWSKEKDESNLKSCEGVAASPPQRYMDLIWWILLKSRDYNIDGILVIDWEIKRRALVKIPWSCQSPFIRSRLNTGFWKIWIRVDDQVPLVLELVHEFFANNIAMMKNITPLVKEKYIKI